MKRGFLKARDNVARPAQAEANLKPVLIPVSPQIPPNIPRPIKLPESLNIFTIPQLNISTQFLLYVGTKEAMLKQLEPVKAGDPSLSAFDINEGPGQGLGMFAKSPYNTGDLIHNEPPLLVIPQVFAQNSVYSSQDYLKLAVERMHPLPRHLLHQLHNCKSNDPKDAFGIIETNALGIGRLPGPYEYDHAAIFYKISRVNHSCTPNAEFNWDLKTFQGYLTASRHIAAGEQIFIGYCPIFRSRTERQGELRAKYAFTCDCASCSMPKDLSTRSDVKRKILSTALSKLRKQQKEHEHALREWIKDLSLPDNHILKPAQFLMQLMQEEQAFDAGLWLTQAEIACKALCALSDNAGVVDLAQKASAYAKTIPFGDHASWSKVAAAPEKTEWWGLRKKATN